MLNWNKSSRNWNTAAEKVTRYKINKQTSTGPIETVLFVSKPTLYLYHSQPTNPTNASVDSGMSDQSSPLNILPEDILSYYGVVGILDSRWSAQYRILSTSLFRSIEETRASCSTQDVWREFSLWRPALQIRDRIRKANVWRPRSPAWPCDYEPRNNLWRSCSNLQRISRNSRSFSSSDISTATIARATDLCQCATIGRFDSPDILVETEIPRSTRTTIIANGSSSIAAETRHSRKWLFGASNGRTLEWYPTAVVIFVLGRSTNQRYCQLSADVQVAFVMTHEYLM